MRLSELLGLPVRTESGDRLGVVHDVRADPEYGWTAHRVDPIRTVLTVPILRGGEVLGVIGVNRPEVRPFSEHQIELLESFASQAVIAIPTATGESARKTPAAVATPLPPRKRM